MTLAAKLEIAGMEFGTAFDVILTFEPGSGSRSAELEQRKAAPELVAFIEAQPEAWRGVSGRLFVPNLGEVAVLARMTSRYGGERGVALVCDRPAGTRAPPLWRRAIARARAQEVA